MRPNLHSGVNSYLDFLSPTFPSSHLALIKNNYSSVHIYMYVARVLVVMVIFVSLCCVFLQVVIFLSNVH